MNFPEYRMGVVVWMIMRITLLFIVACLLPLGAADPSGAVYWNAADFKTLDKKAAAHMDATKSGMEQLMNAGNHSAIIFHREGNGQAELHEKLADFIVVRSGEGAVSVGGKVVGGKPSGPGEVRGTSVEGGTRYKLAAGDVIYIPANTPHQMLVEPGKQLNAMVIKVEAKQ